MNIIFNNIVGAMFVLTCSTASYAEVCNVENIKESTPIDQFLDLGDGTITDISTGLMWMKCSYGQTYVNGQCEGDATHINSWGEALIIASDNDEQFDLSNWRMPNIKELDSIVERRCVRPSINLVAFPNTPAAVYYSSTPHDDPNQIATFRAINFETGEDFFPEVSTFRYLRLVRYSKSSGSSAQQTIGEPKLRNVH